MSYIHAIFIFASLLCGWLLLRCLGNERQQRLTELEQRLRRERDLAAPGRLAAQDTPADPSA